MPDTPPIIAVLTALSIEYRAIRTHLTDIEMEVHPTYGTRAEVGRLPDSPWRVALLETGGGTHGAATLTERAMSWFSPEAVLFVGVASALKNDIEIGDVVVATKVYAAHGGKETPEGFMSRPETWHAPHHLEQAARHVLRDERHVHFRPIAAVDVILTDSSSTLAELIRRHYNDAAAVETEGSGVATAAHFSGTAGALIIRGISDKADTNKAAANAMGAQQMAAANAAEATVAVIRQLKPKGARPNGFDTVPAPELALNGTDNPVPIAATTLPHRNGGFTGRSAELSCLLPQLAPAPAGSATLSLLASAVTGMGGIGKTALAIEAAQQACSLGWFPGGTLFIDLRGYAGEPIAADQAVLALLDALGVRGPDLPQQKARQYDAYHRLLSERKDRVLLILDNASDPAQFLRLLPGSDLHRVLITSRDRPDSLPVRLTGLGELTSDESTALVTRALHDADEHDDRAEREPDALRELAALCGHLPLALQTAAALLRRRRHRDIASLVTRIRDADDPTLVLDNGSRGTDLYGRPLAVRPVLDDSYRRLHPDQARLLRLLALAPGPETGSEAVAALADLGIENSLCLLEDLAATHLVTPMPGGQGPTAVVRWRSHDLLRRFTASIVAADADFRKEGEAARERLLAFYCQWATAADDRLRWLPGRPAPERFTNRAQALAWLDTERVGLLAAVQWAQEEKYTRAAVRLAERLAEYLSQRRYFDDLITVARTSRKAARRIGDRQGEAVACNNLGIALREAGRTEEAVDVLTHARDLFQAAKDRHSEAGTWNNLGNALHAAGRVGKAIEAFTHARDLHRAAGDRLREAAAWGNLGSALRETGQAEEALAVLTQARDLHRSTGDHPAEASAWNNLGNALGDVGRVEEAIEAYSKAVENCHNFEDWYGAGLAFRNLAVVHETARNPAEAHASWLKAADAYAQANAPTEAAHARTWAKALK